jgi:hypothetical protein
MLKTDTAIYFVEFAQDAHETTAIQIGQTILTAKDKLTG